MDDHVTVHEDERVARGVGGRTVAGRRRAAGTGQIEQVGAGRRGDGGRIVRGSVRRHDDFRLGGQLIAGLSERLETSGQLVEPPMKRHNHGQAHERTRAARIEPGVRGEARTRWSRTSEDEIPTP